MGKEHITGVLHVGISVYRMDESVEWYRKNLGFEMVQDDGFLEPLGSHVCFLEKDGFQIELFEYKEPKALPQDRLLPNDDIQTVGTKHVAFEVNGIDKYKEMLLANGVEIVHEVQMNGDHVMFIHDCNGILIELIEK